MRPLDEPGEPLRRMEDREEQHEVRAGRPEMGQLDRLDDELLGQDGDRDRGPDRAEVVDRAAEPVRLAQDGDRDGATGLVRASPGDDVLVAVGDLAGRRRAPLDLGDDVEARGGEPVEDRPGRRGRGGDREVVVEAEAGHLVADVGAAAFGDLGDDVRLAAPRRCGRAPIRRPGPAARGSSRRCPFGLGRSAGASASRRSARSRSSSSDPSPASIVSPARSIPASSESTAPATSSAAPALRSTTSRLAPGSPRSTDSVIRALSAADPPASLAVDARRRPSAAASTVPPLDAVRRHVVEDAGSVERQLVDAVAVDHERPLGAEEPGDLGDPRPRPPRRRRRGAGGSSRPGSSAGRAG